MKPAARARSLPGRRRCRCSRAIDPLTDAQTDVVCRRELIAVVTRRALERAMG